MMERERRVEALSLADRQVVIELADEVLADLDVTVTRGPSVGLLMLSAEEPSERLPFYLTEVTVSEAEVSAKTERGYAMVLGREPEKALAAAVLDVAVACRHSASERIERMLQDALAADARAQEDGWRRVAATRVQFEELAP